MSIGLYRDVHVPAAITRGLLMRGVDVLTAQLDDATLLDDPDLLAEANKRQRIGTVFGGVIYAHQTGITIGQAIHDLQILAEAGKPEDFANRVEYLPW